MKVVKLDGAMRLTICGDGAMQLIWVYSTDHPATQAAHEARWNELYG
jgi:hypothetical protein